MSELADRWLRIVFGWTVFTFTFPWLAFVKSLLREDNRWAFFGLAGTGTNGDFWALGLLVGLGGAVLGLAWYGPRRLLQGVVLGWHLTLLVVMFYGAVAHGRQATFEAGAFGLVLPLWWIGPLLCAALVALTVRWIVAERRRPRGVAATIPVRSVDRRAVLLACALAPLIVVCFRYGGAVDGVLAKVGVVATALQWVAISAAVRVEAAARGAVPLDARATVTA
jgi:hypothetical protein